MTLKTLELYAVEFFTGYLLQGLAFVLFAFAISRTKIDKKKYIISSLILTAFIFLSRNFNMNFGVHTIMNIIILVGLTSFYCKMPINKCTISALVTTVLMVIIELLDVSLMMAIFTPESIKEKMKDPMWNVLIAIPATTALLAISIVLYLTLTKKKISDEKNS